MNVYLSSLGNLSIAVCPSSYRINLQSIPLKLYYIVTSRDLLFYSPFYCFLLYYQRQQLVASTVELIMRLLPWEGFFDLLCFHAPVSRPEEEEEHEDLGNPFNL